MFLSWKVGKLLKAVFRHKQRQVEFFRSSPSSKKTLLVRLYADGACKRSSEDSCQRMGVRPIGHQHA